MSRKPIIEDRRRALVIALVGYGVIVGLLMAWQAVGLLAPNDSWPTLSDMLRRTTHHLVGRWILFGLWLWLGWHLFVRGWRFFLRA
jgi:hypothetical protein